jgi:hypothetical protein
MSAAVDDPAPLIRLPLGGAESICGLCADPTVGRSVVHSNLSHGADPPWHEWRKAGALYVLPVVAWAALAAGALALQPAWIQKLGIMMVSPGLVIGFRLGVGSFHVLTDNAFLLGLVTGGVVLLPVLGYLRTRKMAWLAGTVAMVVTVMLFGLFLIHGFATS